MSETKSIAEKFADWWMTGEQSKKLLWVGMLVLIVFPIFNPLTLPIGVNRWTRDFYDTLVAVPDGGIAILTIDFGPGDADMTLSWQICLKQLARKNMDIVIIGIWSPISNPFGEILLNKVDMEANYGYVYGVDIVYLGWLIGEEVALGAIYTDFKGTVKSDFYGASTATLPLIQRINDHNDIDILVIFQAYGHIGPMYARQWASEPGRPTIGHLGLEYYPQVSTGYLGSATEYEVLSGITVGASVVTDIKSLAMVYTLSVVLIGNLAYRLRKQQAKAKSDVTIFE
jgi:hypothetical protein